MNQFSVHESPRPAAPLSIGAALQAGIQKLDSKSASARLDAEILLAHVLGRDRSFLRAWPETRLDPLAIDRYRELIESRQLGVPIAYLIGHREFWSGIFRVSPAVLIPRPETELLVEMALEGIPSGRPAAILELGTGSGVIAVSLAMERPAASILATDISPEALRIARENAGRHRVQNIQFLESDWFESIPTTRFDLVISNPPYVAEDDPHLSRGDLVFEPKIALKSGRFGMDALELIAANAGKRLNPGGRLLVEHGCQQATRLTRILERFGYRHITTRTDLQGHPRATRSRWPGKVDDTESLVP